MTPLRSARMKLPRILLVGCEYEMRSLLRHSLERAAYVVDECGDRSDFQRALASDTRTFCESDLVLLDQRLIDRQAVDVIRRLQQRRHHPPVVLIEDRQESSGSLLDRLRIAAVIQDPADVTRNIAVIRQLVQHGE